LELIAQLELEHQGLSGQDTDAFWHDACKWGGRLLAAAGVIGLILSGGTLPFVAIIGGLVSWLSSWFESKEEKRRKAVAKIMEQLGDTIDDQEKEVTENATEKFGESLENLIKSVQEYFELLEKGLSGQGKALSGVAREVRDAGLALEHAFAKRLVDWLEGSSGGVATEEVRKRIARTARALGKSFTIHVNGAVPDRGRLREIESLLGEQITIETI